MKKLAILVLFTVSCGGSDNNTTPPIDAMVTPMPDATPVADCFSGTPTTQDQLLNACVDQSVTRIIKYPTLQAELTALPHLNPDGSLPGLP